MTFPKKICYLILLLFWNSLALAQSEIVKGFKNPDIDAKPMLRWWFPSADHDVDLVKQQITDAHEAGFGGVEVALVPHYTSFDAKIDGWGTPKWKSLMKTILKEAGNLPEKFKVDFTITAHWPPSLNTIDPNDAATSQELAFTYQKIISDGRVSLQLPNTKEKDRDGTPFIFTDTFVAASLAKVASVGENGIVLDSENLKNVTSFVAKSKNDDGEPKFTLAGIPEEATTFGDKPKLADKQFYYEIDVDLGKLGIAKNESSKVSDQIEAGDWLLFSYYHRGTGQSISGIGMMNLFLPMADGMYATSYYDSKGTDAITEYWKENLLDEELIQLLKSTGGDIFEDSIESASQGPFWTADFLKEFEDFQGFDVVPYMPFIASEKGSRVKFTSTNGIEKKVSGQYHQTLNQLYLKEHIKPLQEFTSSFGYGYRAQAYGASIETSGASAILDVSEGESLGFGLWYDQFRNIAGGVHMAGKKYVSDEILADLGAAYKITWKSSASTLNSNFAAGVNRAVFHGMSYPLEPSNEFNDWPGWHPFQAAFAEPWGRRQIFWDNVQNISGFVARNQAVLQAGKPKMDIAVYKAQLQYGYGFEALLDNGFSYDVIGTPLLLHQNATYVNGAFAPAQYKAIVVNSTEPMPITALDKLLELAKAGLPIAVVGESPIQSDNADYINKANQLLKLSNVLKTNEKQLVTSLNDLGVSPDVSFQQKGLRSRSRLTEDGTLAHFIYNDNEAEISVPLKIASSGTPYLMDAWTGKIYTLPEAQKVNGNVKIDLTLAPKQSILLGIGDSKIDFADQPYPYITEKEKVQDLTEWKLTLESWEPADEDSHPFKSKKISVALGEVALGPWENLEVAEETLRQIGVDSLKKVSGIGTYSTSFNMNKDWQKGQSVILSLKHGDDMVTEVTVNGTMLKNIDALSDKIEIGPYLQDKNTLTVTLASTLINRVKVEHKIFKSGFFLPGPPPGDVEIEAPAEIGEPPMGMPPMPKIRNDFSYGLFEATLEY